MPYDHTKDAPTSGLSEGIKTVVIGADATTTGQALVDITGMTQPLSASATYLIEACLSVNSTSTAGTNYGVNLTSTSGATIEGQIVGSVIADSLTVANMGGERLTAFATAPSIGFVGVAGDGVVKINAKIVTGATPPTLSIQHEKLTSGTSTVKAGSTLTVRRVA